MNQKTKLLYSVFAAAVLPLCAQAEVYLDENFESGTIGVNPYNPALRATNQVLTAFGTGPIGGDNVAHFNDSSASVPGQLEYVVGPSALGSLYFRFDLLNNQPSLVGGTLNVSVGPWNDTLGGALNGNANCAFRVQFGQDTGSVNIRTNTGSFPTGGSYNTALLQTVQIWVNDNDSSTLSYIRPDSLTSATLGANSAVVWINDSLVGTETDAGFFMNTTPSVGSTVGDVTLGRVGFNTTTANFGNWLIDNVHVSAVPEPSTAMLIFSGVTLLALRLRRQARGR